MPTNIDQRKSQSISEIDQNLTRLETMELRSDSKEKLYAFAVKENVAIPLYSRWPKIACVLSYIWCKFAGYKLLAGTENDCLIFRNCIIQRLREALNCQNYEKLKLEIREAQENPGNIDSDQQEAIDQLATLLSGVDALKSDGWKKVFEYEPKGADMDPEEWRVDDDPHFPEQIPLRKLSVVQEDLSPGEKWLEDWKDVESVCTSECYLLMSRLQGEKQKEKPSY